MQAYWSFSRTWRYLWTHIFYNHGETPWDCLLSEQQAFVSCPCPLLKSWWVLIFVHSLKSSISTKIQLTASTASVGLLLSLTLLIHNQHLTVLLVFPPSLSLSGSLYTTNTRLIVVVWPTEGSTGEAERSFAWRDLTEPKGEIGATKGRIQAAWIRACFYKRACWQQRGLSLVSPQGREVTAKILRDVTGQWVVVHKWQGLKRTDQEEARNPVP